MIGLVLATCRKLIHACAVLLLLLSAWIPFAGLASFRLRCASSPEVAREHRRSRLWAADGARGALESRVARADTRARFVHFVYSALPAHAVRCSMRVSCSTNFLLHEGMRVVCVRVRHFFTIAPPNICHARRLTPFPRSAWVFHQEFPTSNVILAAMP